MLRPLVINPVLNGFVVTAGCQTLVFNTPDQLGAEIARFYKDPNGVEKEYITKAVNKTMDQPALAAPAPCDERRDILTRQPNPAYENRALSVGAECATQCAESPTPTRPR